MFRQACKILNNIIICLLIIFAVIMFVPKIIGWQNLAVLSGSMEPNIPVGAMVIVRDIDPSELKKGDVITFQMNESTYVTHRIVSIDKESQQIITKGDANDVVDGTPVNYSNVIGKLFLTIPYLGYFSISMQSLRGVILLIVVILILILLNLLPDLFDKIHKKN